MNKNLHTLLAAFVLTALITHPILAGNTWDGGGGNNDFTTGANWTGDTTPGYGTLTFDNTGSGLRLSPNNNNGSLSMNGILFNSGTYSYTIGGNTIDFFDNGGTQSKINNDGSASQTINLTVDFENTNGTNPWAEINPVSGNLTFGSTVNMNGSQVGEIRIYGDNGKKVTFNGAITGGAGKDFRIYQYSIAEFNASMTYQGETEIKEGELWIAAGGDINAASAIYVGDGGRTTDFAKLYISDLDGGTTFDNTINVNPGNGATGNRTVGGINTSGTNTFSGTISRASDGNNISLTLFSDGGTVTFDGNITGNDAVLIDANGNGVINYANSAKTYSGDTYILDGELRVQGNFAPGNVYLGETSGSDAATFSIGASGVTENAGIIVRNGSAGTLTVTSAQAAGDATFSGTVALDNNVTLSSSSGGRTIFSGEIKDGDGGGTFGAAVNTAGTVQLSGSAANSGTSWTVQEGTLELNKSAGTNAINGTTIVEAGGTLKNLANNQISDSSAVTIQSSGSWNLNDNSERVGSLDVDGTLSLGSGVALVSGGTSDWAGTVSGSSGSALVFIGGANNLTAASTGLLAGSAVYVVGGKVGLNNNNAAGSAGIYLGETNGSATATIDISTSDVNIANNITIRGGSDGNKTLDNATTTGSRTITFNGNVSLADSLHVDASSGETTIFGGVISNSGGIIKRGFGTMSIAGASTFGGVMAIDEGSLRIASGGDLTAASNITIGSSIYNGGAGAADLTLASGASAIDRSIVVASGAGARLLASEGNNTISGAITQSANLTVSNTTGTLNLGAVTMNTSGNNDLAIAGAGNVTVGGTITAGSGASSVDKSGAGTLTISGDNSGQSYMLNVGGGKVVLSSANALGTSFGDKVNFTANSTLNAATNIGPASLGLRVANGVTGTVEVNNGNNLTVATLGSVSGTGTFNKTGAGTMTLTGTSTTANANNVSAGTLVVSNGATLTGTTTVTNATLDVDGTLAGAVTVNASGKIMGSGSVGALTINGVLAPGNSAGTTTATNGSAWIQGASYEWEIFNLAGPAGTGWDLLSVTAGTLDLTGITGTGGFTINLITLQGNNSTQGALSGFSPSATYTNWMIASAPTISGFVASEFNLNSGLFVGASGTFAIEQRAITGGQGLFVTYTAGGGQPVPEPGTWAAAALLAGAAGYVRWRRRTEQSKDDA